MIEAYFLVYSVDFEVGKRKLDRFLADRALAQAKDQALEADFGDWVKVSVNR